MKTFRHIPKTHWTLIWLYAIYLFNTVDYLEADLQTYHTQVGSSITFVDLEDITLFSGGEWWLQNPLCHKTKGYCRLCRINYKTSNDPIVEYKLINPLADLFNHTCNKTALHIYNISIYAANTTYRLLKTDGKKNSTTYYYLTVLAKIPITYVQYVTTPSLDKNFNSLKFSGSNFTTPIIVTVITAALCTVFGYVCYHRLRKNIRSL
ncbi:membrane protein RL11C [Cercopithecine betaherpesvirus 5]|uniref:Membrane protein RL11C n=1 Tax=Simian cytomegalovirus (strain Colburn) TaxID=50292 RepID=G8XTP8_SCMVC|nr:membrane protein RL11C [Cercopithecine betaherpesvirus 5]